MLSERAEQESAARQAGEPIDLHDDGQSARLWCFLSIGWEGIRSNAFQLTLTVLTMSVGAMALALTFFIGRGAIERVWQDVEEMMGQWVVAHSDTGLDPRWMRGRTRPDFTESDLQQIKSRLSGAKFVCPIYMNAQRVASRNREMLLPVDGITEEVAREPLFRVLQGRGFSDSSRTGMTWECMVTEAACREFALDLKQEPILVVGRQPHRIVGVVPDPPRADPRYQSRVIVPYGSARILWIPPGTVGHIIVGWLQVQDMNQVMTRLKGSLDEVRGPNTYYLSSSQFTIGKSKDLVRNLMLVGKIQSFFCILVASIGVLNVMLTSVSRRTREFSTRLVMGASRRQILGSVVFEAMLISSFGALLGMVVAVVAAPRLTALLAARLPQASLLAPLYCPEGFIYPLLVCGICGLVAGVWPAIRAGRVDVLAALRAEP
jgi:putative ABC transport system permease protein